MHSLLQRFGHHLVRPQEMIFVLFELTAHSCNKYNLLFSFQCYHEYLYQYYQKSLAASMQLHRRLWTIEILVLISIQQVAGHHLCWNICATNARLRLGEPSTISFAVKYLLQPILSACSRTNFALCNGSFAFNADGLLCSGARTFNK